MIEFPGRSPIITYTHRLRSRYAETDKMGYVYYGRYLEYFEAARTELIRSLGVSYSQLEKDGFMLPVIYSQVEYKAPIFYDELMTVEVMIFKKPVVKLETWYKVFTDRQPQPHTLGQVNLCFTDSEKRKPCKAPGYFLDLVKSD